MPDPTTPPSRNAPQAFDDDFDFNFDGTTATTIVADVLDIADEVDASVELANAL